MRNGNDFNGRTFSDSEYLKYLFLSSEGRINRQRFWLGYILMSVAVVVVAVIGSLLTSVGSFLSVVGGILIAAAYIVGTIAGIFLYIKRAHDRDHVGWYILLTMIPFIGIIWAIELAFFSGTSGNNEYGHDPRA